MDILVIGVLIVLGLLGGLTYTLRGIGAEVIVSHIGGVVIGINKISTEVEYNDEEEEDVLDRQHILSISLIFISITYVWYSYKEEE